MLGYIYSITSKSTGMVYIGSTTKKKVKIRFNQHNNSLLNHTHKNWKLRFLVAHQGMNDLVFKMELKGYFPTYQDLLNIEGIWIKSICEEFCLNIDRYPELRKNMYRRKHRLESINKIKKNSPHLKGENSPNWKRHPSEETRAIWSKQRKGSGNPMYKKKHKPSSIEKMREKALVRPSFTEEHRKHIKENHWDNSGENHPNYGKVHCDFNFIYKSKLNRYYFILSLKTFCTLFSLDYSVMLRVAKGKFKSYKGWTGEYAPQWLVDKVKPSMKSGQFWVEIDIEGNIIP